MNIVYSADDNYARHAGISIMSLYEKNKDSSEINVFLINDNISSENVEKLNSIAKKYGRNITYIDFSLYKNRLILDNKWELPISAYARLFVGEMLPSDLDNVLYLDCDTIVNDSLKNLWETGLCGCTVAGVEDVASCIFQNETDTEEQYRYICTGVVFIDLVKWREKNIQGKLLEYIDSKNGVVKHHDQTILNGVLWNDCYILHPRYDALTPTFIMSYKNLKAYYGLWNNYYTEQEIRESVKNPAIIHYTSSHIGRPWENDAHPLSFVYQKYWERSPWKDVPMSVFKCNADEKQLKTYRLYQKYPVFFIRLISKVKRCFIRR